MALTLAQYREEAKLLANDTSGLETCTDCDTPLQESITGYRPGKHGPRCSDCYFSAISDMIDEHPIGRPMATRAGLATKPVTA
jgi:hypothetical protein